MQAKSYELHQFHKRFFIYGGIAYLVYVVFAALVLWLRGWQLWVTLLLGCLLLGSAYVAGRRSIGTMSRELRAIVDIMNQILEAPEQVPAEPYKQGELGELYTNLYKLVQALKESNRKEQEEKIFLRDIMSDISHQLKTPLASLTVFLDLLYDGRVPDVDKQKQMLLESKNQVSRMEWMVLSMLKLARIEAGAIQFEKHPCSLYAIVAQAKESVAYLTEKRGQQIDVQIDEKQMLVCDGDWLTEAIINLLKNASDYSGEQTTIHIWTEDNPMYTRIYVKDEGCGIAESELKNIFKRFYRINKEVNPNSVGIGLSLTKSIVEGMGGKISVRSELGCYTQFGELSRMTQFKMKSQQHADNITAGLFTYPVLMAADILLYQTDLVPVGEDQRQHVELCRDIGARFNNSFPDTFKLPEAFIPKMGARIMSLGNPDNKMSKSDPDGCVFLMDKPEDIMRKFKRAVTDCETAVRFDKDNKPGISNLLTIYCAATGKTIEQAEAEFADQGYGVFKPAVGEAVVELVRPIREKTEQMLGDKAYLESIYKEGAERASYLANKTLRKVYKKVGFVAR